MHEYLAFFIYENLLKLHHSIPHIIEFNIQKDLELSKIALIAIYM